MLRFGVAVLLLLYADPKLNEEFKVKTFGGAVVSVCAVVLILLLFLSELRLFLSVDTVDHLFVDVSRGEKLRIHFDVTFPHIPCSLLSLDAMDVSGSHQLDVSHHIKKKPLDELGNAVGAETVHTLHSEEATVDAGGSPKAAGVRAGAQPAALSNITMADIMRPEYCGPCYGAETAAGQCCRTCSDVKDQYRVRGWAMPALTTVEQCVASGETIDPVVADLANHKGCQMYGYLEVNKGTPEGREHPPLCAALPLALGGGADRPAAAASPLCCASLCACGRGQWPATSTSRPARASSTSTCTCTTWRRTSSSCSTCRTASGRCRSARPSPAR